MSIFIDDFSGTADQLVSSRPGWTVSAGSADEWKLDGLGSIGFGVRGEDSKALLHETSRPSHYLAVVIGDGFLASTGDVMLCVNALDNRQNVNLSYDFLTNTLRLKATDTSLWSDTPMLSSGDTLSLTYLANTATVQVFHNGVIIHYHELDPAFIGGTLCALSVGYDAGPALEEVFRRFEADEYVDDTSETLAIPLEGVMKLWTGTTWVQGVLKRFNGSTWGIKTP